MPAPTTTTSEFGTSAPYDSAPGLPYPVWRQRSPPLTPRRAAVGPAGQNLAMASDATDEVDAWGIQVRWTDAEDRSQQVAPEVVSALRRAIGRQPDDLDERAADRVAART